MRFVYSLAAAVGLAASSSAASAITFLNFTARGVGIQNQSTLDNGQFIGTALTGLFEYSFSVAIEDVEGGIYGVVCVASACRGPSGGYDANFRANGSTSGLITSSNSVAVAGQSTSSSLTLQYSDPDGVGGFPTLLGTRAATGGFLFRNTDGRTNSVVSGYGNITSLTISSSSGFSPGGVRSIGALITVPEPATWAMMLVGFGGMGYAMRRTRKAAVSFS